MVMKIIFYTAIIICVFSIEAFAQTTAMTYQGRLNDSTVSQPTNGSYDLLFKIFNAATGGIQQGGQIQVANVAVVNGVFTVQLDFGTVFISPTSDLFLEIAVRPTGPQGLYTTLAPRQQVTSAPFAVQALNASLAVDSQKLGGTNADQFVTIQDARLTDARNPTAGSSNYIQNTNSLQAANFSISGNGTVLGTLTGNILQGNIQLNIGNQRIIHRQGTNNLFLGVSSGQAIATGSNNIFAGSFAGQTNSTGSSNAFFGVSSGANTNASFNSFFGAAAGQSNSTGSQNSFFGYSAGLLNSDGGLNAFFGESAGAANVSGTNNAFFGTQSGNKSKGDNNAFFGSVAGSQATTAFGNTFIGFATGSSATTEDGNTLLGSGADITPGISNSTAIGINAKAIISNTIVLGTSAEKVVVPGLGAAGTTQLCRNAGQQIATCSSSRRYKMNIERFGAGLSIVNRLSPVSFNWLTDNQADFGLVAEDVAKVEPLLVTYNANGEIEGVKYDRIGVVLLNVVKGQQLQIEAQAKQIRELRSIVCSIKRKAAACSTRK